ncbi:MAG: nuclear transport factor 2 family protein, partial [Comamonas sp.]
VDASNLVHPRSKIQVRAVHQGLGERAHLRYDAIGFYEDEWLQLPQGWRIQKRSMTMLLEIGDRSVLQPAPKP